MPADQPRTAAYDVSQGAVDPHSGVKCGWANAYRDCEVPDCKFTSVPGGERCLLVKKNRGEA